MADLSITVASVAAGTGAQKKTLNAAVTILQGQSLYEDATTTPSQWRLALDDTAAHAAATAVALNAALAGQPCVGQTGGPITIGATVVKGTPYYVGTGAGGISATAPASAHFVTFLGYATSTTVIQLAINATALAVA